MDVKFEPSRVVEVWAPTESSGMVGSGYLLGNGLVLTAAHVVDHAAGLQCEARPLGGVDWLPAESVWRGLNCDAALVRIPDSGSGDAAARLGKLGRPERAPCRAVGFRSRRSRREAMCAT